MTAVGGLRAEDNAAPARHQFRFTGQDFQYIRHVVFENAGIHLTELKQQLVYNRVSRRLRQLGLDDFRSYCALLKRDGGAEMSHLLNAITTNKTAFFRENHHFDFLAGQALPQLLGSRARARRLRIWSAGCSSGEEPYSIAMVLAEAGIPPDWDVRVLAADLDGNMLARAEEGIYRLDDVNGISRQRLHRWFLRGRGRSAERVRVRPELRRLVEFRRINLVGEWPVPGSFDAIFCRNVLIYFDQATRTRLAERFIGALAPDGYLFIGHSESLYGMNDQVTTVGNTIYRRLAGGGS